MSRKMKIQYSSSLTQLVETNPSFDCGTLRIAYTGRNRNNSSISKEAFERAIPTMFGCPVVANYIREDNEIGSHDGELVKRENGEWDYVNITEPVGFVPPGANWSWEVIDDGNEIHEYLVSEVVLWKRQEAYKKIKENGITAQSMEISVDRGEMVDGCYAINDFYFTAFCLLGTAEPCFEDAALITYSADDMKDQLTSMYEEFKLAFADDKRFNTEKKVGEKNMKLDEFLAKYSVALEDLEFEVEGLSDEELETKFSEAFEVSEEEAEVEPVVEEEEFEHNDDSEDTDESEEPEQEEFALSSQVREQLSRQVNSAEMIESEYGVYPRYYMMDYDPEVSEVYFEDGSDWNLYGAPYSMNGDNVVVDFEAAKRKRYAIVDFNEGEEEFSLIGYVQSMMGIVKNSCDQKYSTLKDKYDALVGKCNKAATDELFERFEDKLSGVAEFEALKKSAATMEPSELEDKLYALVGRKQFKFTKTTKVPKAPVIPKEKDNNEPYGTLFDWKK